MKFVSILMGSKSDYGVMEECAKTLEKFGVMYEIVVSSAHRSPDRTHQYVKNAEAKGAKVFVAAAGMAAHLPGVIAAMTPLPVIGVPINASMDGLDALLAIAQMPPGIPVATVAINGALNAAILSLQIMATGDKDLQAKMRAYKQSLKEKIVKANEDLSKLSFKYKV